ncbi:pseudouridine synthase [Haoranjiania flava]|uniref:Pseudouridine synthase n=1 Tax=Haoranjiania flava TaxID=1856322 RepID=A0AAE3IRR0_9BACT|nr:pseudouridine synthase [Haoranjiania flava]MCU7695191.1 pseudouridine synthase [Haoranjiania flava]
MKNKAGFEKFINPQSNAKKKEAFRQEKRKAKADMRAFGEELRREKFAKDRGEAVLGAEDKTKKYPNRKSTSTGIKKSYEDRKFSKGKHTDNADGSKFVPKKTFRKQEEDSEDLAVKWQKKSGKKTEEFAEKKPHGRQEKYADKNKKHSGYKKHDEKEELYEEKMPLNKYIAHSGVCGRREAAELVKQGFVKVNNDVVYEPGYKVTEKDTVKLKDKPVSLQQKMVYVLMNKPKDHITTMEDDKGRKTVTDLVKSIPERIYPVGRLDRNTTGVLLLTNDGELAQKLMHPSFEAKKIYEATLDKALSKSDAEKILAGIELEDGFIKADAVGYADAKDKRVVGIEIHSGKNHIVKRIFYHLGYTVTKLDRVMFANLTKKNVERGKWRFLNEKEVRALKMLNAKKAGK